MNRNRKAFTIVELVIVIAVIAILSAVMIPTFSALMERAAVGADTATIGTLNGALNALQAESDAHGDGAAIKSDEDLYKVIQDTFDAGKAATFAPESAKYGYHYWYDAKDNKIVLVKDYNDLKVDLKSNDYNGFDLLADGDTDGDAITFNACNVLRYFKDRYYLIDRSGSELVEILDKVDEVGTDGIGLGDIYTELGGIEGNDNNIATIIKTTLETTAVVNAYGTYVKDSNSVIDNVYFSMTANKLIGTDVVINNNTALHLTLPSNVTHLDSYSLEFTTHSYLYIDTTEEELINMLDSTSVQNCDIVLRNGAKYTVNGSKLLNANGDMIAELAVSTSSIVSSMELSAKANANNKIELAAQNENTYNLYVAVDYTGDIELSVLNYRDEEGNKIIARGAEWAATGNVTYENGKFKVTGFADDTNAFAGTITVTVQDVTNTINVYGVKPVSVTVDYTNNEGLTIQDIDQNNVLFTLSYDPTANNTFNFTPSLVMNHKGTSIVLDSKPQVSDETGKIQYSYSANKGTLTLPANTFEDEKTATTTLTVTYNGSTLGTEGNITYTLKLINKLNGSFAVNDEYVTSVNYSLDKYYVGNSGKIKLSYLFKVAEGKDISGREIVVEVYQGQARIDGWKYDDLNGELDLSDDDLSDCVGEDIIIKIGVKNSPDREELRVCLVDATNIASGDLKDVSASNVVLHDDVSLTSQKTFNNIYGNLHKITADNGNTVSTAYWTGFLIVKVKMTDTIFIGPVYDSVAFHAEVLGYQVGNKKAWDGVSPQGTAQIINSYIFGFRSPVVMTGATNVKIINSTIEGGTLASIHVAGSKFTLTDTAIVQDKNGYKTGNKTAYGLGIFCDDEAKCTINLEGTTKFYTWISQTDANSISASTSVSGDAIGAGKVVELMLANGTEFIHTNEAGTQYINTGIIIAVKNESNYVITVNDNREDGLKKASNLFSYKSWGTTYNYRGYSYKTCNSKVGSAEHPFLPENWTSQTNNNYKNFLKVREK